jgi:hypothetical protein
MVPWLQIVQSMRRAYTAARRRPAAGPVGAGAAALLAAGLGLAVATAAGCSDDAPGSPDASATDGGVDGGGSAGLRFAWQASPAPEAAIRDDMSVTSAELALRDVRCIGDAAPGDARTWRAALDLEWKADHVPPPLVFDDAPPGIYSSFELRIDGNGGESYRIEGMVLLDGEWLPWRIEDEVSVPVALPVDIRLEVGSVQTLPVDLDLVALLAPIDWHQADSDEGELQLDEDDPQLAALRQRLSGAFTAGTASVTAVAR